MMRKIIYLFIMTIASITIRAQHTNILSSITGNCPSSSFPYSNAHDADNSSYYYYSVYSGCGDMELTLNLSETAKAVLVKINSQFEGVTLGDYYTTQGTVDEFYYINPDGFTNITLTHADYESFNRFYDIQVLKIPLSDVSLDYGYDACGNMKSRTLILSLGLAQKSAGKEEDVQKDKLGQFDISLFPNPTKGQVILQVDGLDEPGTGEYTIYNSSGKVVKDGVILPGGNAIDLTSEPTGLYFMKLQIGNETQQWKIIKE
jgi:hypothetical protein